MCLTTGWLGLPAPGQHEGADGQTLAWGPGGEGSANTGTGASSQGTQAAGQTLGGSAHPYIDVHYPGIVRGGIYYILQYLI